MSANPYRKQVFFGELSVFFLENSLIESRCSFLLDYTEINCHESAKTIFLVAKKL